MGGIAAWLRWQGRSEGAGGSAGVVAALGVGKELGEQRVCAGSRCVPRGDRRQRHCGEALEWHSGTPNPPQ